MLIQFGMSVDIDCNQESVDSVTARLAESGFKANCHLPNISSWWDDECPKCGQYEHCDCTKHEKRISLPMRRQVQQISDVVRDKWNADFTICWELIRIARKMNEMILSS